MSTTRAEIDAKASGERRAFMLRMNAALEQAKAEHAAGCDANLARWCDAPVGVEDTDAMLAFDNEAKRLMDIADARLDELQQESELEHARHAHHCAAAACAACGDGHRGRLSLFLFKDALVLLLRSLVIILIHHHHHHVNNARGD